MEHDKSFIIIGNLNAITYKEIFGLLRSNKMWLGINSGSGTMEFGVPEHYPLFGSRCRTDDDGNQFVHVSGIRWFANLDVPKRHEDIVLYRKYDPAIYLPYDNYPAINVDKVKDIPCDYPGMMGVPITFLDKYNPSQFEIVKNGQTMAKELGIKPVGQKFVDDYYAQGNKGQINPRWNNLVYHVGTKVFVPYQRILIRNKRLQKT